MSFFPAETITITPKTGDGAYGPVFGDAYDLTAESVEPSTKHTVNALGENVIASLWAVLPHDSTIKPGDAAEYDGLMYAVLSVERFKGEHCEVYFASVGAVNA